MDKLRRTFTGSATGALTALLIVGAITFGATVVRPMTADRNDSTTAQADDTSSAGHDGGDAAEPSGDQPDGDQPSGDQPDGFTPDHLAVVDGEEGGDGSGESPAEQPADPPAEEPKDEPRDEPKDEPPSEPPASSDLSLEAFFNADLGKIVVEWSAYTGDFEKYKLIRSTDAEATWPLGEGDQLVDVVGADGDRRFVDADAPCNVELHYRAFAVRYAGDGYLVLASSNVGAAGHECTAETPAEPSAMGFELLQTADGVQLSWEACTSDAFVAYKVVRSATNENPTYPLNDGTELIGVIGDAGATGFVDPNVEVGQTWTYRVLCMGQNGDGWYVLGLTDALGLTVA